MKLSRLIKEVAISDFQGDREVEIKGLAYDSRKVKPGFLFVALRGYKQNGHDFVKDAIRNGAVALVAETIDRDWIDNKISIVHTPDSRKTLSKLAVNYYRPPFDEMNFIGITGTNGKTTTCYMLESILLAAGAKPGVIGTINYRLPGRTWKAPVTTPESLDLMRILRKMADAGVSDVIMEVSSHALDQGRINNCPFRVAVFTNLSRDHLDYHSSMEAYFEVKSRLFLNLREKGPVDLTRAVINADDPKGKQLVGVTDVPVLTYGLGKDCDVRADNIRVNGNGLTANLISPAGKIDIQSSLIGDFNIYNILAASAVGLSMDIDLNTVASGIERLKEIPGRLELVKNRRSLTVVVDYAHTPDALLRALKAVKSIVKGRLITVFGCGGDRDTGKRREMGLVAGSHSDLAIVTSDNPRTEDPMVIASQIEEGVREAGLKKLVNIPKDGLPGPGYLLDLDRGHAIKSAISMADEKDLILIAGKGHEDYQIIGEEKRHFDDRKVAAKAASGEILMSAQWGETIAEEILSPINGVWVSGKQQTILTGLSTDSRKIGSGELFWALSGERYDGHDFIEDAVRRGAVGIVVQKGHKKAEDAIRGILNLKHQNSVVITVDDTLKALGDLASWWRHHHNIQIVAITGSTGKTTTKEMTANILELGDRTLKNKGNFNNLIGLPLSLLRLNKEYQKAVLEMGMNRPGEIARLTEIADPDVGVITNVGSAHLEGLGDIEGVARAKMELVEKISSRAEVVLNGDDELLMKTAAMFPRKVVTFGTAKKNDVIAANIQNLGMEGMSFILQYQGRDLPVKLRSRGFQNVLNALAAAAAGICLNESPEHIVEGLGRFGGLKGRFMVSRLPHGVILVDDTYNANPSSLKVALESLEPLVNEGKKIIVGLGEMMELGDATVFAHQEAGRMVAELGAGCFLAIGEHANEMKKGAVAAGMPQDCVGVVETHSEMVSRINEEIREGDLVFLKGSRKMTLEKVVEDLNRKIIEDN